MVYAVFGEAGTGRHLTVENNKNQDNGHPTYTASYDTDGEKMPWLGNVS